MLGIELLSLTFAQTESKRQVVFTARSFKVSLKLEKIVSLSYSSSNKVSIFFCMAMVEFPTSLDFLFTFHGLHSHTDTIAHVIQINGVIKLQNLKLFSIL